MSLETAAANSTNIELKIKKKRISFAKVFDGEARTNDDGVVTGWNRSLNILLDKVEDADIIQEIKDAQNAVAKAKWPDKTKRPRFPDDTKCLRDGEHVDEDTGEMIPNWAGYEGKMYVSASRAVTKKGASADELRRMPNPIKIIGPRKNAEGKFPVLKEEDDMIYSGAYANIIIRIYAYDGTANGHKSRINASLEAIQFAGHGERFGAGSINAEDAFDEEDVEDDFDEKPKTNVSVSAATDEDDI